MNFKEEIKERQKINRIIVEILSDLVEKHPTQRFGQILLNYFFNGYDYNNIESGTRFKNIIYNEEPTKTLSRCNLGINDEKK